jgi:hypothetical protein
VSLAITVQVIDTIIQPDAVLLKEAAQLEASVEPEKPPHLLGRELSRAISLKRETLQSGAAQVLPFRRQLTRDVLGQFKGDVHGQSISDRTDWRNQASPSVRSGRLWP